MADNQFVCPACGGNFQSKEELDSHVQEMHGKNEEQSQEHAMMCSKCGLKAKSTQELEEHEQHHSM